MNFYCTDSLVKIFPDTKKPRKLEKATALKNEIYHMQLFLRSEDLKKDLTIESSIAGVSFKSVEYLPMLVCNLQGSDEYGLNRVGVCPDLLLDVSKILFSARANISSAIFVSIDCSKLNVGVHIIRFFLKQGGHVLGWASISLEIVDEKLVENDLIVTEWMHFDCIADYYDIKPWTAKFFVYVKNLLYTAVSHGINTVLVPCFTPPLDTEPNRERTNVQLVGAFYNEGKYHFDFYLLEKFILTARECGIKYFEINHLFSQWGAEFSPTIYVTENGKKRCKFGWNISSESEEYKTFLTAFLPALYDCLTALGVEGQTLWHISDEPAVEHLERYKRHLALLKQLVPTCKIMDALSAYEFKGTGMDIPVVALDAVKPFVENNDKVMVYFCTAQDKQYVPNHFLLLHPSVIVFWGL